MFINSIDKYLNKNKIRFGFNIIERMPDESIAEYIQGQIYSSGQSIFFN